MGEAISGFDKYALQKESPYREITYRNGNSTWKATTIFCPTCSKVREKDSANGGFKDKWVVNKEDYFFTLRYAQDQEGKTYAECSKCGTDLRFHIPEFDTYVSIILRSDDDDGPPLPTMMFTDTQYEQGFFFFPASEHERIRNLGTQEQGRILPATEYEGQRYAVTWNDFLSKVRYLPSGKIVAIPKTYFKSI